MIAAGTRGKYYGNSCTMTEATCPSLQLISYDDTNYLWIRSSEFVETSPAPKIGQRWSFNSNEFICEIIDILDINTRFVKIRIVPSNYSNEELFINDHLHDDYVYLAGQDAPTSA
jgi:hypothetical protein